MTPEADLDRFAQRLGDHPIHETLRLLRAEIGGITDEQREAMDATGSTAVPDRALEIWKYVTGLLASVDPRLAALAELDALNASLRNARDQLSQVRSGDASFTANVDQELENALAHAAPLAARVRLDTKSLRAAGDQVGDVIQNRISTLARDAATLRQELDALATERDERADAIAVDDDARVAALQLRVEQIDAAVTSEKVRFDSFLPTLQTQFAEAEAERTAQWNAHREAVGSEAQQAVTTIAGQTTERAEALLATLDDATKDAEAKRSRVEKLYGLITDKATSGAFADEATAQQGQADAWRGHAVKFGIASAIVAVLAVAFSALDQNGSPSAHVGALVVAVLLSGLTGYAAKQSGSHREREVRARRLALELAAFGPFTDHMEERENARKEYADRLFRGGEDPPVRAGDHHVTFAQTVGEGVIELLRGVGSRTS